MKKALFFTLLLIAGCKPFSKRINSEQDIQRGRGITDQFYAHLKSGSVANAAAMCSNEVPEKAFEDLIANLTEEAGMINSTEFLNGKSDVTEKDGKITGEIDLDYRVKYDRASKDETVVMKFVNDSLKIAGYHYVPSK